MKIGEFTNYFLNTIKLDYYSDKTLLEYDMLILNFNTILKSQTQTKHNEKFIKRRKLDLKDFIDHKKVPIVIIVPSTELENCLITNIFPEISSLLPIGNFKIINQSGEDFAIQANTPFKDFFNTYKKYFRYRSYFTQFTGTPILKTPLTNHTLAYYNDNVVFIPEIVGTSLGLPENFLKDLYDIVTNINKEHSLSLPEWTQNYQLPNEASLVEELKKQQEQLTQLNMRMAATQANLDVIIEKKALFTESGNPLENAIEKIFCEIGLEILEAAPDRDDLIVKHRDQVAVIEIKGVNGSSAEKQSAQLEKWVTTYYEKTEVKPKGILIVNSYREQPLSERDAMTFPHQMLKYAQQREHCLITTLQLMGLYFDITSDETKKELLLDELFATIGIYPKYADWSKFITPA